jgi:excisionase family DNA binding protein
MKNPEIGELTDVFRFAEALDVKPTTVRAWIYQRKVSVVRVGGRAVRIPVSEIARLKTEGFIPALGQ